MGDENIDSKSTVENEGDPLDFKIISENQKIIKSNIFRYNPRPFILGGTGELSEEPEIKVKKNEKDVITGIEVRCVCGKLIQIECN